MYEDNVFQGYEETVQFLIDDDLAAVLDYFDDPEEIERLNKLAERNERFPAMELNLQELKVLDIFQTLTYDPAYESAEFYRSMAGMHGTKVVDGVEYAVMDDFAYHYFHELMTVEVVDPQGKQFVMIYGIVDNWREVERQEKAKEWDPGEDEEPVAADGIDMWDHPYQIVSMIAFRNEIINRMALEFRKNGVPLNVQFRPKRSFMEEILEKRAVDYHMPGIAAAFAKVAEKFGEDEHIAFLADADRIKIFYADTDETIEHMMGTCFRKEQGKEKLSRLGEMCYDTFFERIERALFELIFLTNKPTDEIAFLSGVSVQELDDIRAGEKEFGNLTLKDVNRLLLSFPELLNLDQLLI